ncbi:MAG: hypothetical protein RQ732_01165 [Methylophaga sp.]|nr:hypothetical protein [Methylophaga sp.]
MIAAGSILFISRRWQHASNAYGHTTQHVYRVVDVLNVTAISELLIACVGYLWINRLLPLELSYGSACFLYPLLSVAVC